MSAASVIASIIKTTPSLIRMFLSLFWTYLTLGWRVRKTRRAFERQLILQGMSKEDAKRLSFCFEELKKGMVAALKRGISTAF